MYYENFVRLCNSINKSPSAVVQEIGLQKSTVTRWKNGSMPTDATAQRVAAYFGVPVDFLLDKDPDLESFQQRGDHAIKRYHVSASLSNKPKDYSATVEEILDLVNALPSAYQDCVLQQVRALTQLQKMQG